MHSQPSRGYHNASLLLSSLSDAPFLGAPRRWSVSPSARWGSTCLGTGPRALPDPMAIPGVLVCPANESSQGLAIWRVRRLCKREPQIPSGGAPPCLSLHSIPLEVASFTPARPSHQSGSSRGWCGWNLTGVSRNVAETSNQETKHHTQRAGELRFITLVGPEELTLQALLLLLLLCRFSRVRLCATPQTAAHQAPPSLGFSRQEHWSGLPFPSPVHESEKRKWSHSVVSDS